METFSTFVIAFYLIELIILVSVIISIWVKFFTNYKCKFCLHYYIALFAITFFGVFHITLYHMNFSRNHFISIVIILSHIILLLLINDYTKVKYKNKGPIIVLIFLIFITYNRHSNYIEGIKELKEYNMFYHDTYLISTGLLSLALFGFVLTKLIK